MQLLTSAILLLSLFTLVSCDSGSSDDDNSYESTYKTRSYSLESLKDKGIFFYEAQPSSENNYKGAIIITCEGTTAMNGERIAELEGFKDEITSDLTADFTLGGQKIPAFNFASMLTQSILNLQDGDELSTSCPTKILGGYYKNW